MVPEQRIRTCSYQVCRMVEEKCVKQVPVCTTRPVHFTKTVEVCRMVPKKVPYTVIRCVPKVVYREVACDPGCGVEPSCSIEPGCGIEMDPARHEDSDTVIEHAAEPTPAASDE